MNFIYTNISLTRDNPLFYFHHLHFISRNYDKSIQRLYNTFEKSPPPSFLSLSLSLPLPVLAQLYFLFIRKNFFLPFLIAACYELKHVAPSSLQFFTPSPLITIPLLIPPFFPFQTRCSHLEGIFGRNLRTRYVGRLCKSHHKRYEVSWRQILKPAGDKTKLYKIILQKNYKTNSFDTW